MVWQGHHNNWQINESGLLQNGIHRRIAGPAGSGILQQLFLRLGERA